MGAPPSVGTRVALLNFADAVGRIQPSRHDLRFVEGWMAGSHAPPSLWVRGGGRPMDFSVETGPATGQAAKVETARRFLVVTDCPTDCEIVVGDPAGATSAVPWERLVPGDVPLGDGLRMMIEYARTWNPARGSIARDDLVLRIARPVARAYAAAMPVVLCLAAAGLVAAAIRRRAVPIDPLPLALAVASLAAIASRVALLAYLDVTSIPSVNMLYAAPATPFVILFAVLGCVLGWRAFMSR